MYSRFEALENYGEQERRKLQNSKVAVIGLGATGSVIAENLARHGIKLKLVDRDYLEENDVYSSNIYTPEQCKKALPKAEAAKKYLEEFVEVEAFIESLNSGNTGLLSDVDLIIDGTDNLHTRFIISEHSQKEGTPWIYTSALAEKAYSMLFDQKCFNCIFEEINPGSIDTCESSGIMREIAGRAALVTSEKAVRYLTGREVEEELDIIHEGRSLDVEGSGCEVCRGERYLNLDGENQTTAVCGENKYQVKREYSEKAIERLKNLGNVIAENKYLVRVEIGGREITVFNDGRIILDAKNEGHAEALVSEKLGI